MKLFYRKVGKGDPVIILHGLFGMSDNWMSIARRMAKNYSVYIPDQRNHGRSPHSDDFNYDLLLDDLNAFIYERDLQNIKLIGHSMGGKVAMRYALNFPAKVDRIVVVDIAPRDYNHPHFKLFFEALFSIDSGLLESRLQADQILAKKIENPAIRQFLLKNLYRDGTGKFRWRINLNSIFLNLHKITAGLNDSRTSQNPALFIRGGNSDYVTEADISIINKIFQNSRIETIENTTHWLHTEAPEQFCELVKLFFDA